MEHADDGAALAQIATILEAREGRRGAAYKVATLRRLAERRRRLRGLSLEQYAELLRGDPLERAVLIQELRVGYTRFLRDPDAFAALQLHLDTQLATKQPGASVRVWCAGCASGEEAFSLAMLLAELPAVVERSLTIRIFATDLDQSALRRARSGICTPAAVASLPPDCMRHFDKYDQVCRVKPALRRMVVFGRHDMLLDPPFLRVDLVSCRNVMIYLEPDAQERLLARFHSSLIPGGTLFLGRCEAPGPGTRLFDVVDREQRIFRRREGAAIIVRPAAGRARDDSEVATSPPTVVGGSSLLPGPCALLDDDGDVLLAHGDLRPLLASGRSSPVRNLLSEAAVDVRPAIVACMREATAGNERSSRSLPARGGRPAHVVTARRAQAPSILEGLTLIAFQVRDGWSLGYRARPLAELEDTLAGLVEEQRELWAATEILRRENEALRRRYEALQAQHAQRVPGAL